MSSVAEEPTISINRESWRLFLDEVMGRVPPHSNGEILVDHALDGTTSLTADDGTVLTFTSAEWVVFVAGVCAGEFELAEAVVA